MYVKVIPLGLPYDIPLIYFADTKEDLKDQQAYLATCNLRDRLIPCIVISSSSEYHESAKTIYLDKKYEIPYSYIESASLLNSLYGIPLSQSLLFLYPHAPKLISNYEIVNEMTDDVKMTAEEMRIYDFIRKSRRGSLGEQTIKQYIGKEINPRNFEKAIKDLCKNNLVNKTYSIKRYRINPSRMIVFMNNHNGHTDDKYKDALKQLNDNPGISLEWWMIENGLSYKDIHQLDKRGIIRLMLGAVASKNHGQENNFNGRINYNNTQIYSTGYQNCYWIPISDANALNSALLRIKKENQDHYSNICVPNGICGINVAKNIKDMRYIYTEKTPLDLNDYGQIALFSAPWATIGNNPVAFIISDNKADYQYGRRIINNFIGFMIYNLRNSVNATMNMYLLCPFIPYEFLYSKNYLPTEKHFCYPDVLRPDKKGYQKIGEIILDYIKSGKKILMIKDLCFNQVAKDYENNIENITKNTSGRINWSMVTNMQPSSSLSFTFYRYISGQYPYNDYYDAVIFVYAQPKNISHESRETAWRRALYAMSLFIHARPIILDVYGTFDYDLYLQSVRYLIDLRAKNNDVYHSIIVRNYNQERCKKEAIDIYQNIIKSGMISTSPTMYKIDLKNKLFEYIIRVKNKPPLLYDILSRFLNVDFRVYIGNSYLSSFY
ncbi:MAG: hypothetical protein NZM04_00840 [Methylacidiphilales bacterium]|nr:hypothetical protein [Candidatus Methylacidiphilales bacterium]